MVWLLLLLDSGLIVAASSRLAVPTAVYQSVTPLKLLLLPGCGLYVAYSFVMELLLWRRL